MKLFLSLHKLLNRLLHFLYLLNCFLCFLSCFMRFCSSLFNNSYDGLQMLSCFYLFPDLLDLFMNFGRRGLCLGHGKNLFNIIFRKPHSCKLGLYLVNSHPSVTHRSNNLGHLSKLSIIHAYTIITKACSVYKTFINQGNLIFQRG